MVPRLAALLFLLLPLIAADQGSYQPTSSLRWETQELKLGRRLASGELELLYTCRNTGPKPIGIADIKTGCSCVATGDKAFTLAPGEAKTLRFLFRADDRLGPQEQQIQVLTDEPLTHFLSFTADLVEPVALSPRLLFWQLGSAAEPKQVRLRIAEPALQGVVSCEKLPAGLVLDILPEKEPGLWTLRLRPLSTQNPTRLSLTLQVPTRQGPVSKVFHVLIK